MKGLQVLIEPLTRGGHAAALMRDGRLDDLLIDTDPCDKTPHPEAIYRAVPTRPMKGVGGVVVDLGDGLAGFLRGPKPPAPGRPLLVQVAGWTEPGKAPPVTARLRLKGRFAMLTPGAPGTNLARSLRDPARRAALTAVAGAAMADAEQDLGLVLRSAAAEAGDAEVSDEIARLRAEWAALQVQTGAAPACLRAAPGAAEIACREWLGPGVALREAATALADAGVWEDVAALGAPLVALGAGTMAIEPTRALVAVDVNTGGDLSPAAALKVNLAAATELPRQLRLRGLGGQVTIDFAPVGHGNRPQIEAALNAALRTDGIETTLAGWTPLGHLELQRKRARRPLARGD